MLLLYPLLVLLPVNISQAEAVTTTLASADVSRITHLASSARQAGDGVGDSQCNIEGGRYANHNYGIHFGQEDNWRCYIEVLEWDITSLTRTGITNIKMTYTDKSGSDVFDDINNNKAEIRAKVSSSSCHADNASNSYLNEIDNTWTLLKGDWIPVETAGRGSEGEADITSLKDLLSTSGNYLCISLSQAGQSIATLPDENEHRHWMLEQDSIKIIINDAVEEPENVATSLHLHQPISTIVEGDSMTLTGRLTRTDDGSGISGKLITFRVSDTVMGFTTTDNTGNFSFPWVNVMKVDENNVVEYISMTFSGDDSTFGPSTSDIYYITINPYNPQAPLTPASPISWQTFISTQQSNAGEVCDDFGAAIPHSQLSFGMTDNYRCYISVAMWDLSSITSGLKMEDISNIKLSYRGAPHSHCANGNANCDPDPDRAEIRYTISNSKCYKGFENHNSNYWREIESSEIEDSDSEWEILEEGSNWNPMDNIYNTGESSISMSSLINQINDGNYLCLAFSQSGTNKFLDSRIHHAYWRITDITFDIQTKETILNLDSPDDSIELGESITFSGRLLDASNNEGIGNMLITIFESDSTDADCILDCGRSVLATGFTQGDGSFSITWASYCEDSFEMFSICTLEVYAEFASTVSYSKSNSEIYNIDIISELETITELDSIPSAASVGSDVIFTGRVTELESGIGVFNAQVEIFENDGFTKELIGIGLTDQNGVFSVLWNAEDLDWNDDRLEIYARFGGSDNYKGSQSSIQYIDIDTSKIATVLILNQLPNVIDVGEPLIFSGSLTDLDGNGISGALIEIREVDDGNWLSPDTSQLVISAISNSDGSFSITWTQSECLDFDIIGAGMFAQGVPEEPCVNEFILHYSGSNTHEESFTSNVQEVRIVEIIDTALILNNIPPVLDENTQVQISGRLIKTNSGEGMESQLITIFHSRGNFNSGERGQGTWANGKQDVVLGQTTTTSDGTFSFIWTVTNIEKDDSDISACRTDCSVRIYAYASPTGGDYLETYSGCFCDQSSTIFTPANPPTVETIMNPSNPNQNDLISIIASVTVADSTLTDFRVKAVLYIDGEMVANRSGWQNSNIEFEIQGLSAGQHSYYIEVRCLNSEIIENNVFVVNSRCGENNSDWVIRTPQQGEIFFVVNESNLQTTELELELACYHEGGPVEQSLCLSPQIEQGTEIREGVPLILFGTLTDSNGNPVTNSTGGIIGVEIRIVDLISGELLVTTVTKTMSWEGPPGYFSVVWEEAYCPSGSNPCNVLIAAEFVGTSEYASSTSTRQLAYEISFVTSQFIGEVICEGKYCVNSLPGVDVTTNPIIYVPVFLISNGEIVAETTTDSIGQFSFTDVMLIDNNGQNIEFTIKVLLTDNIFVKIMDCREAEIPVWYNKSIHGHDFTCHNLGENNIFEKSEYIGSYSYGESVPFIPIKFTSPDEMDAASMYTHARRVFAEYIVPVLEIDQFLDFSPVQIFLFEDNRHFGSGLAHAGPFWSYSKYGSVLESTKECFDQHYCHISMSDSILPSGSVGYRWKDTLVHEIIHLSSFVDGAFRYDDSGKWREENMANLMAEVINTDLGEVNGVSMWANIGLWYGIGSCWILESPYTGYMFNLRTQSKNEGWTSYIGYANSGSSFYVNYCSLQFILWDFVDDDKNNPHNSNPNLIIGEKQGIRGDERDWPTQVRISGKTMWDAMATQNIYNLQDVYNILSVLDLNNNGIAGEQDDRDLADQIFEMHGVPGGLTNL